MDLSNSSLRGGDNVTKVYISDSPVADDIVEYNYVSSDIEDELDRSATTVLKRPNSFSNRQQKLQIENMPPQPDLSEVDELAKEADYQRELQDRLQKTTIAEPAEGEYTEAWEAAESDSSSPLSDSESDENSSDTKSASSSKTKPGSNKSYSGSSTFYDPSKESFADANASGKSSKPDFNSDMLEWKNPPVNPFENESLANGIHSDVNSSRYDDGNKSALQAVSMSPVKSPQQPLSTTPYKTQYSNPQPGSTGPLKFSPLNSSQQHKPSRLQFDQQDQQRENGYQHPMTLYQQQPQYQLQQPLPQQQQQQQQRQQISVRSPQPIQNQQFSYQSPEGYDQDAYTLQQQQVELENEQYQQLQQQQLQQQQLFVQQQMLQQQLQQQQQRQRQQQIEEQHQALQGLALQRNVPVMYMQHPENQNEYYAVTPRDSFHPSSYPAGQNKNVPAYDADVVTENGDELWKRPKAIVAPKPVRPSKNYVEKNKIRAAGQMSAKPGYSQRLVQKRVEQEQMKEWAPGMIIPRKKAASADDIIRGSEREELQSAEDVWSKRSRDLANAKQQKLAGGSKNKKQINGKPVNLKRFPSDNSLSKRNRIPPIAPTEPKGYLASYRDTVQGCSAENLHQDYSLPGQLSPQVVLSTGQYNKYGPPQGQTFPPNSYETNIPHHPPLHPHQLMGSPSYIIHQSPYGGDVALQYQNFENSYQPGPPSGGYHHQPRQELIRQPEYHQPHTFEGNHPGFQQQPSFNPGQSGRYSNYPNYNYSGYLSNPPESGVDPTNRERELKPYDGSPYSSPHPPYSGNTHTTDMSSPLTKKPPLNPYATVPPIHNGSKLADVNKSGSYVIAYQKEKEKVEKFQKGPTYKVYTMTDYKKLKLEYKLGGLGPSQDPEALKEKNELRLRQLQYAKEAMDQEKKKPHPTPRRPKDGDIQQISGRQLMVEYAKHIPKPKVAPQHNSQPAMASSSSAVTEQENSSKIPAMKPMESSSQPTLGTSEPPTQVDLVALEDLQWRHEEERRAVAEIQYKMQQTA